MPKVYVRTLFQELQDEDIDAIAENVFTRAALDPSRTEPVPPEEEWSDTIKYIRKTMSEFPRVRNSEYLEIENDTEECIRRYNDGDDEPYDIEITDWRKVSNMEVHKFDDSTKESYCLAMAILILALTYEGYDYKRCQEHQEATWDWIESIGKRCIKKERKKTGSWPPKKPGRKKKGIL